MEHRVDAFRTKLAADDADLPGEHVAARPVPAMARRVGLVAGLPLHLAAILLWWPASRLLRAAGARPEAIDRVSHWLVG